MRGQSVCSEEAGRLQPLRRESGLRRVQSVRGQESIGLQSVQSLRGKEGIGL